MASCGNNTGGVSGSNTGGTSDKASCGDLAGAQGETGNTEALCASCATESKCSKGARTSGCKIEDEACKRGKGDVTESGEDKVSVGDKSAGFRIGLCHV